MSLEFLITALVVVLVPGSGVVYTVAIGLGKGRKASVAAAFGCTLGIVPAILASVFGLSALLHTSALVFQAVKYAGVAYLLYLAWQTLRESGPLALTPTDATPASFWAIARSGCLINVLNPKLTVFFLAFLPQFVSPGSGNAVLEMLGMSAVFMAMTFAVFVVYGLCAARVGHQLMQSEKALCWMRRAVAATFCGFGVRLALADR
ncbi:LysE family translocator [Roseibium sp. RKSG952]|uniref:LysE family translocator n=1 Tax=Roseibium sp. RKSG952 TaxID=2529384 RepID=UPI001AD90425|nr:LysE family translocator [Roseibium sp. RKSG952]